MKQADHARRQSLEIITNAPVFNQRTGQYLFNGLPEGADNAVRGTLFDPFYREFSQFQVEKWLQEHVIFNESGSIIGIFNNDEVLWERNY